MIKSEIYVAQVGRGIEEKAGGFSEGYFDPI